jgi:hypothetical protein
LVANAARTPHSDPWVDRPFRPSVFAEVTSCIAVPRYMYALGVLKILKRDWLNGARRALTCRYDFGYIIAVALCTLRMEVHVWGGEARAGA